VGSGPQDMISVWAYLDPAAPPREVMLQFYSPDGNGWEHRAYWGENLMVYGYNGQFSLQYLGNLPVTGQWVELLVPTALVGLTGFRVGGVAFDLYDGAAWFDEVTLVHANGDPSFVLADDGYPPAAYVSFGYGASWVSDRVHSGVYATYAPSWSGAHEFYFVDCCSSSLPRVAADGPLAYYSQVGSDGRFGNPNQTWYDRNGQSPGTGVPPGQYTLYAPFVSPYQAPAAQTVTLTAGANP